MHRSTHPTSLQLAVLASVVVLTLAACGSDRSSAGSAAFNDADVEFLQGMVPHHSQAVAMAELVPDRTDRPELNELAETIISTQNEEIEQMNTVLSDAGAEPVEGGMDHGGMTEGGMTMSGMMDDQQMQDLESAEGQDFELMFLDMMTAHHQGAIEAAEQVLDAGENPEVADLAEQIIQAQQAEIEQMATWKEQWS
ncbi:MAG: DUF305 domain-containing protein [Actinomycetota bacterium]|jgi:uncharacterized protein (DUF305 family)|nr:DUF305 domain-containing protein [Actinomycetota bacterium]